MFFQNSSVSTAFEVTMWIASVERVEEWWFLFVSLIRAVSHQLVHCSTMSSEASEAVAYPCSRHCYNSNDPVLLPSASNGGIQATV